MRASFYECDITPPLGGFMWGHYRNVRALDVHKNYMQKRRLSKMKEIFITIKKSNKNFIRHQLCHTAVTTLEN